MAIVSGVEDGKIIFTPQSFVARHLAEGLEDMKKGRTHGPFADADTAIAALDARTRRYAKNQNYETALYGESRQGLCSPAGDHTQGIRKQLGFLLVNRGYPSLRAKKYNEALASGRARVTRDWRFYFKIEGDEHVILHPK